MSLNAILSNANSGLVTAQAQLRVVSDNVANVNTKGYVRKIADQTSLVSQGVGSGVEIGRVRLATDRFLQAASLNAGAEAGRFGVRAELYDRVQGLFGDPGGDGGFFAGLDSAFASFAAIGEDALSSPRRQEALFKAEAMFAEAGRIAAGIQSTRQDADARLSAAVEQVNGLVKEIEALNVEMGRSTAMGADTSGIAGAQAQLVAELGTLVDVRVTGLANGGISVRTGGGALLAGPGSATLSYQRAGTVGAQTVFGEVRITEPNSQARPLQDLVSSGEIKGLLELRDVDAPETAARLAELTSRVADELNRVHNDHAAVPAPRVLTGRNVGQDLTTALTGFSGQTTVAVTDAAGRIVRKVDIEFVAPGGFRMNGAPAAPATEGHGTFLARLNTALGSDGSASFTDGRLSIQASAAGNGIALGQGEPASAKGGRSFSHLFGLNDLVQSGGPLSYDTGMTPGSAHGFAAGQTLKLRLSDPSGTRLRDIAFAVPAGGTMSSLLAGLNDPVAGAGRYGTFSLSTSGELSFKGHGDPAPVLRTVEDQTAQSPSGVSLTTLFGLGEGVRTARATDIVIRPDVRQNGARLATARLDVTAAVGSQALLQGDGRGATALAGVGNVETMFAAAGDLRGGAQTISRYGADLSGSIGSKAALSQSRADSAGAVQTEALARQSAFEGVNLDEELVLLTTYQQAFNASARLVQAAREMYDILMGMT